MGLWLLVCACIALAAARGPEQIHISFGYHPSQMIVMWSTEEYGDSVVMYGKDQFHLSNKQSGSCWRFTDGNPRGLQYMHRVLLEVRMAVYILVSSLIMSANYAASGIATRRRLLVLCRDVRQRQ